jgi:hypothetical protein
MGIDLISDTAHPLEQQIFNQVVKWIILPFDSNKVNH